MKEIQQLEIQRLEKRTQYRWPAWLNLSIAVLAAMILLAISIWTVFQSERSLEANVASKLKAILQIESEAVSQWVRSESQFAVFLANDAQLVELMAANHSDSGIEDSNATVKSQFEGRLADIAHRLRRRSFVLMTPNGKMIASSGDKWLRNSLPLLEEQFCESQMSGRTAFSSIFCPPSDAGSTCDFRFVVAEPIQHPERGVVGFLGIGYEAGDELTRVLKSSRSGETGEALAVTATGELISQSRFANGRSHLDLFANHHREQIQHNSSEIQVGLVGELDHRGVPTVFASQWNPKLGIGLIAKMDHAEANAPISQIRLFVWTLFSMLLMTTISTLFYRWYVYRLRMRARQSDLDQKRLGAYVLEGKVGEGGMGVVFRAKHALLRRPTAIKILPPEKSSPSAIDRFEREVQYTSQLKHPNTIAIYDYGRSENGLFYYAMELLDGLNLEQLIRREVRLSDGRTIKILKQVCESLREAHSLGLIHRDIKPANIMLCDQGGAVDTVKVLDFGMVRDRSAGSGDFLGKLSGTPTYMAPECFTRPAAIDSRVDVFAVGAVGFFLLTGKPLLAAANLPELIQLHNTEIAEIARHRILSMKETARNKPISAQLIKLICQCVSTDPNQRPNSIDNVLAELVRARANNAWRTDQAGHWWRTENSLGDDSSLRESAEIRPPAPTLAATQVFLPATAEAEPGLHRFVRCPNT